MTTVVAVTAPEFKKAASVFESAESLGLKCVSVPDDEAGLVAAIQQHGATHCIVGVVNYKAALYDAISKGNVIARFGVGHDGIDKPLATSKGILCSNTPGALDDSVAEHVATLLLGITRQLPQLASEMRAGQWAPRVGQELRNRTIAVIGCGPIGRRVARCAAFGFGMRVIGCEIAAVHAAQMQQEFGFECITSNFADAVKHADYVSLHIPSIPATKHFINATSLAHMPKNSILINTGTLLTVNTL